MVATAIGGVLKISEVSLQEHLTRRDVQSTKNAPLIATEARPYKVRLPESPPDYVYASIDLTMVD